MAVTYASFNFFQSGWSKQPGFLITWPSGVQRSAGSNSYQWAAGTIKWLFLIERLWPLINPRLCLTKNYHLTQRSRNPLQHLLGLQECSPAIEEHCRCRCAYSQLHYSYDASKPVDSEQPARLLTRVRALPPLICTIKCFISMIQKTWKHYFGDSSVSILSNVTIITLWSVWFLAQYN